MDAFEAGDGGERLTFDVTFRAPRRVIQLLNGTLPAAFGDGRGHNVGVPPADGSRPPFLQVGYKPLVPGPANVDGTALRLPIAPAALAGGRRVGDRRLADEAAR